MCLVFLGNKKHFKFWAQNRSSNFFQIGLRTRMFFWGRQNFHSPAVEFLNPKLAVRTSYPYCEMFYDTRTIAWDNFYFLRCTHQAHHEHFWKVIFWCHFLKSAFNLEWPIFCAWWPEIKKNWDGRRVSIYLRPVKFGASGNNFRPS